MNCATHPEAAAVAYCRNCGKALCNQCRQEWQGVIYCSSCLAQQGATPRPPSPPLPVPPVGAPSPAAAFVLGLIPGVGAIYNGQYAKGILHIVVLGLLISIANSDAAGELQPVVGMLIAGWFFYMAFEAYHTAKRRLLGEPVDEFSGLLRGSQKPGGIPIGPILLIALGVVFLLNTLGYLAWERIVRFWPVLLIAAGLYSLFARLAGRSEREDRSGPGTPSSGSLESKE